MTHNIHNPHEGVVHIHDPRTGKSLNLKPGINRLSDDEHRLHEAAIKRAGLEELEEMCDAPIVTQEASTESHSEEPKAKKKHKKAEVSEALEPLNEG